VIIHKNHCFEVQQELVDQLTAIGVYVAVTSVVLSGAMSLPVLEHDNEGCDKLELQNLDVIVLSYTNECFFMNEYTLHLLCWRCVAAVASLVVWRPDSCLSVP
jgi:hypothetical protein